MVVVKSRAGNVKLVLYKEEWHRVKLGETNVVSFYTKNGLFSGPEIEQRLKLNPYRSSAAFIGTLATGALGQQYDGQGPCLKIF